MSRRSTRAALIRRTRLIRRAALPAVAAALAIPLAACGGGKPAGSSPSAATSAKPAHLTVLAAASLTDAFKTEGAAYDKARPGSSVTFSFAGSQELAAQVRQGAPADVLVTADTRTMDGLGSQTGTPTVIARNRLTIVTAPGDPKKITSLADLARPGLKVDLAAPQVPAGNYAQQVLTAQHVDVKPVSQETNVRAVLSKVELGEADAGIVYVTDAESAGGKVATVTIPDAQNSVASYPAATLKSSKNSSAATAFVAFLSSAQGRQILHGYGFQQP